MKIGFYEIEQWEADYIKEHLQGHELFFQKSHFSDDELPEENLDIISTFTSSPITPKVLEHVKNLKFVSTRTTGFDHINLDICMQKGILVSNVPTYGENTVAEFTFALLLMLMRKMYEGVRRVKEEGWFRFDGLRGNDLKDKTIGVIGTGHIGTYVVKIAHGFGMNIVAYDPYPNEKLAQQFDYKYLSLEELLKTSDVVTLHVPYMPSTHHLINKDNIKLFKPGSVLINTARGGLVDTQALIFGLKQGFVGGAAMDVMEEEGFIKEELEMLVNGHPNEEQMKIALADHELMHMDNVLISPHNAFNTLEAIKRILDTTVKNIEGFAAGQPVNVVQKK
jgi:D-lactate dehydrogenase